jgi:hypothetical protein
MGVGFYRDRTLRLDHPISLHPFLQRRISHRANDIGCNGWLRIEFVDPASASPADSGRQDLRFLKRR